MGHPVIIAIATLVLCSVYALLANGPKPSVFRVSGELPPGVELPAVTDRELGAHLPAMRGPWRARRQGDFVELFRDEG